MSEVGVIYMLENQVNGKQYIGQSTDISRRMTQHRSERRLVVEKAIDKYQWKNFELTILEDNIPKDKLDTKEREYIKEFDTWKGRGYNFTAGGDGRTEGMEMSEEAKRKMSKARRGKKNGFYGKNHTEKTKQKMSKARKGRTGEDAGNSKLTDKKVKIIKYLLEGNHFSQRGLGRMFGVDHATIGYIKRGKTWSHISVGDYH